MAPDVPRGQLVGGSGGGRPGRARMTPLRDLARVTGARPHFVNFDFRLMPNIAAGLLRRLGVPVLTWTIKSADDYAAARRIADNCTFEGFLPGDPPVTPPPE